MLEMQFVISKHKDSAKLKICFKLWNIQNNWEDMITYCKPADNGPWFIQKLKNTSSRCTLFTGTDSFLINMIRCYPLQSTCHHCTISCPVSALCCCLWLDTILWSNCRLVNESTDLTVSLSNRVPLIRHITPDLMYVCSWAGCLCSPLWHHITATEGLQCFSLHCHRSSRWGEVRDCVIRWSVLLSETSTPVVNLTSSHCLSLEVCDAQVIKDGRSNTELLSVCINNSCVTLKLALTLCPV